MEIFKLPTILFLNLTLHGNRLNCTTIIHFFSSFTFCSLLPTHSRWRKLLLHLITLIDTLTHSHTHTHKHTQTHSVRLLLASDRPVAQAATYTTHNIHNRQTSIPLGGIRIRSPQKRVTKVAGRRQRGHRDRHNSVQFKTSKLLFIY